MYLAPENQRINNQFSISWNWFLSVFSISLNNTVIVPETTDSEIQTLYYFCLLIYYIRIRPQSMKILTLSASASTFLRFFPLIFLYFVSKTSHLYAHNNALLMNLFPLYHSLIWNRSNIFKGSSANGTILIESLNGPSLPKCQNQTHKSRVKGPL